MNNWRLWSKPPTALCAINRLSRDNLKLSHYNLKLSHYKLKLSRDDSKAETPPQEYINAKTFTHMAKRKKHEG